MKIRGIKVRKSNTFCWRDGNKIIDKDFYDKPVDYNYFVVLRKKDCPIVEKNGLLCYDTKNVKQAFKIAYGGTYYGYGKDYVKDGIRITPFYTVYKGTLYVGNIKHNK